MAAYYNENDPFAAQWLRNLIAAGHIMQGEVDERSIRDVAADDLRGFTRCHFFAGIAGWDYALRLAGWPEDRAVWTGSCPCQPFSVAGKQKGNADERHLWPEFYRLIAECRPETVFGEQVEGAVRHGWLDLVFRDMEGKGYACGAAVLGAHSVRAPHIRQRLFWMADAERNADEPGRASVRPGGCDATPGWRPSVELGRRCNTGRMADRIGAGLEIEREQQARAERQATERGSEAGAWDSIEWLPCIDGKARPTQPGIFPLLNGFQPAMDSVFSIQERALMEIDAYGQRSGAHPDQIMRMVWDTICSETGWEERPVGMRGEFHAAPVLLDFLLNLEAARHRTADCRRSKKACTEIIERTMRSVRRHGRIMRSPHQRGCDEQPPRKSPKTLRELSFVLARLSSAHAEAAISAHAALVRTGTLRAAGNAIVPQVAAAFIEAVMECAP